MVQLDRNVRLVMRAAKKPPAALIEHLREHARDIAAFLRTKAAAERAEARLTVDAKANAAGPGGRRASIGFGICDRCPLSGWPLARPVGPDADHAGRQAGTQGAAGPGRPLLHRVV
jgi:hypothetical protein